MIVTILLGVFTVLFTFLTKYKNYKYGLEIAFILIFFFLALRNNFGNDYQSYYTFFSEITKSPQINFKYGWSAERVLEPGWILLCWLFKPFGFYAFIAFHSFLFSLTYYFFFKIHVPKNLYWLSIFIFIFDPTFLLIQLSTLRQSFASIFIILSYQYIYKKKLLPFILCILCATLFHSSALIFLPAYLLCFSRWVNTKLTRVVIFLLYLSLIFYGKLLSSAFIEFINSYFKMYTVYFRFKEGNLGSGVGFAYQTTLLILTLYIGRFQKNKTAFFFNITIICFLMLPINLLLNITQRLIFYFHPAILVSFPIIINHIKNKPLKILIGSLIVVYSITSYYRFINSATWSESYVVYKTIFPDVFY